MSGDNARKSAQYHRKLRDFQSLGEAWLICRLLTLMKSFSLCG